MATTTDKLMKLVKDLQDEAYQKGWDDAVAKILASATGAAAPRQTKEDATQSIKPGMSQYQTPIIDMVHQIVNEKPGLRGVEVVKEIIRRDPSIKHEVADRTGRTSLSRLHKRGEIEQRDQKWYPAKKEQEAEEGVLVFGTGESE